MFEVLYAVRRGFFFVLPKPGAKQKDGSIAPALPSGFLLLESKSSA